MDEKKMILSMTANFAQFPDGISRCITLKYNLSDNVNENCAVYMDGELMLGDDSDWDEGGEG